MTFQQLRYLLEVYNTGSITAAAQSLYLAQSSLSIAITNLENELGCQIFTRTKNGMVPTTKGLKIINRASRICAEYQMMTKEPQTECRRVVFSGSNLEAVTQAYLQLLEEHQDDRDVIFSIETNSLEDSLEGVAMNKIDTAVLLCHEPRLLEIETSINNLNLSMQVLGYVPAVATIGPGHRLYRKETVDYRELEQDTLVDTTAGTQLYNHHMKGIMQLDPDRTLLVENQYLRRKLIARGLAYCIGVPLPRDLTAQYGYRSIPLGDLRFAILVITNPNHILPPEADRFIELLREAIQESPQDA